MTKNDLQSDLLADLQGAANARPLPVSTPERLPATPALPGPPAAERRRPTPALAVRVTPLRWDRPRVVTPSSSLGLGLRLGPVEVSLSFGA